MNRFEESVIEYINANPYYFLNYQLNIPYKDGNGGTKPDMVVFDVRDKSIIIVEVSSAWDISSLLNNLLERYTRWYNPIKNIYNEHIDETKISCTLFLRKNVIAKAKAFLITHNIEDVQLQDLEEIQCAWNLEPKKAFFQGL
jgi:hypothetical protein